jgi:hypothetical protein
MGYCWVMALGKGKLKALNEGLAQNTNRYGREDIRT